MPQELAPHQQRVIEERDQLLEKLRKLQHFMSTPTWATLPMAEAQRLILQKHYMEGYVAVLGQRICAFGDAAGPVVTDAMVQRFLQWPVPAHIHPDGTPGQPGRTGTNLLDAQTTKAMLAHVLG